MTMMLTLIVRWTVSKTCLWIVRTVRYRFVSRFMGFVPGMRLANRHEELSLKLTELVAHQGPEDGHENVGALGFL